MKTKAEPAVKILEVAESNGDDSLIADLRSLQQTARNNAEELVKYSNGNQS